MKANLIVCLFILFMPVIVIGQNRDSVTSIEQVRIQGYLIIEGHREVIKNGSDIPRKFLFIPIEKFGDKNFLSVYQHESQPQFDNLFIPTSFIEKEKLNELNTFLKMALKSPLRLRCEDSVNNAFEKYLRDQNTFFKIQNSNEELNIILIDGIWAKIKVPSKYLNSSYIEGYNRKRLKVLDNGFYEYYYLVETKSFSSLVFFKDALLVKHE